jgi:hypothetical protein
MVLFGSEARRGGRRSTHTLVSTDLLRCAPGNESLDGWVATSYGLCKWALRSDDRFVRPADQKPTT